MIGQELHVTIDQHGANPRVEKDWVQFCESMGIKPLHIILCRDQSYYPTQLMCAANVTDRPALLKDLRYFVEEAGFKIIRYKHEVSAVPRGYQPLYWETHVTMDRRPYNFPRSWGLSRNLYNPKERYWLTIRRPTLCEYPVHKAFGSMCPHTHCLPANLDHLQDLPGYVKHVLEAAIVDTNKGLDRGWL